MKQEILSLAISPCPNDTFIFDALVHHLFTDCPFIFNTTYTDIQQLNEAAAGEQFDVIKISYAQLWNIKHHYHLLRSGGAMGYGCGPLLLSHTKQPKPAFNREKVTALPGRNTTAYLLFQFYVRKHCKQQAEVVFMPFDTIYQNLKEGKLAQGVAIHECRFTYQKDGLHCLSDLGDFWEKKTGYPIPLGGIVIRKEKQHLAPLLEKWIQQSILYAWEKPYLVNDYIRKYAQIESEAVIEKHIHTYVNEFSLDIGNKGEAAIARLNELHQQNFSQLITD